MLVDMHIKVFIVHVELQHAQAVPLPLKFPKAANLKTAVLVEGFFFRFVGEILVELGPDGHPVLHVVIVTKGDFLACQVIVFAGLLDVGEALCTKFLLLLLYRDTQMIEKIRFEVLHVFRHIELCDVIILRKLSKCRREIHQHRLGAGNLFVANVYLVNAGSLVFVEPTKLKNLVVMVHVVLMDEPHGEVVDAALFAYAFA